MFLWGSQDWFPGTFPVIHADNFWKPSKMEDWGVCLSRSVRRPCGTKLCRTAEPAVSPLSEVGNKSRVVPILQVIVCAPLLESLHWPSKGILERSKTPQCKDYLTLFTEHQSDFDLLVMPEGNGGGKINILEAKYVISVCRELDLVWKKKIR